MNIKNVKHINKLKKLGYPLNEMLIVGSGTMALYGLKENNDIDLWVTKSVYNKMLKDFRFTRNGKILETKDSLIEASDRFVCVKDKVEDHLKRAKIVDGFHFQSLQDVLEWKQCMKRPKDINDIKTIENYMKKNLVEMYLRQLED